MGLRTKFNLVMLGVFLVGLAISGMLSWRLLSRNAREQVIENAGIMMGAAHAVRGYTVERVRPLVDLSEHEEFVPETVPAFAATETFNALRASPEYAAYVYKEATLNPTNKRDQATDWEADIISRFASDEDVPELVGERQTADGLALWLARPIRITNEDCLDCHSTPDQAPASLIRTYGDANGFGWEMQEVVGSQIVTVPMSHLIDKARRTFLLFMGSLTAVFAALFVALNLTLGSLVIQPITAISHRADQISLGHAEIPEFDESGTDEISLLKASFNRMRRSLERAMAMIQEG
jgi:protein-histidine pros-kinase